MIEYDMQSFLRSSVDLYRELAGVTTELEKVSTPFMQEDRENLDPGVAASAIDWATNSLDPSKCFADAEYFQRTWDESEKAVESGT